MAQELLGLATTYNIDGLKYLCENTLIQNIDNGSAIQILIAANKYKSIDLKRVVINYLIKNFQEISGSKEFD